MSRLDGRYAQVETDADGQPLAFTVHGTRDGIAVTGVADYWREWIGVLEGEPERDIWRLETSQGACELHHMRTPQENSGGDNESHESVTKEQGVDAWVLFRWED
jgi:hypothetical protein